jgi:hypothetical protein
MNSNATPTSGFWRRLWQRWFASADPGAADGARRDYGWVPIRALAPRHKPRILAHLLALSDNDRYLRFGYPATDEHIRRYVDGLNFQRDEIFGIFNRHMRHGHLTHRRLFLMLRCRCLTRGIKLWYFHSQRRFLLETATSRTQRYATSRSGTQTLHQS